MKKSFDIWNEDPITEKIFAIKFYCVIWIVLLVGSVVSIILSLGWIRWIFVGLGSVSFGILLGIIWAPEDRLKGEEPIQGSRFRK